MNTPTTITKRINVPTQIGKSVTKSITKSATACAGIDALTNRRQPLKQACTAIYYRCCRYCRR